MIADLHRVSQQPVETGIFRLYTMDTIPSIPFQSLHSSRCACFTPFSLACRILSCYHILLHAIIHQAIVYAAVYAMFTYATTLAYIIVSRVAGFLSSHAAGLTPIRSHNICTCCTCCTYLSFLPPMFNPHWLDPHWLESDLHLPLSSLTAQITGL